MTAIGLLVSYGAYGLILMQTYQMIRGSATSRPTGAFDPASDRCVVLVGFLGVLAGIVTGGLLRRLYSLATFRYDGRRYGGGEEALDRRGDQD